MQDVRLALQKRAEKLNAAMKVAEERQLARGLTEGEARYVALAALTTGRIAALEMTVELLVEEVARLKRVTL